MTRRFSRRRFVAASLPLTVGIAGCSGDDGEDGSDDDAGDPATDAEDGSDGGDGTTDGDGTTTSTPTVPLVDFPTLSADEPTYRRWQPGTGEYAGIQDVAHNVGNARDRRDALPADVYEQRTGWAMFNGYVGVEYDELDGIVVGLSGVAVAYFGTFDREDVTGRLTDTPYEPVTTAEGVDYYRWERSDGPRFVGVGDAGVAAGPPPQGADDPARQFVEGTTPLFATAAGDRPRLHEESAVYERYTDAIGWPLVAWAGAPRPGDGPLGTPASGSATPPGGDAVPEAVRASVRVGFGRYLTDGSLVDRYWLWTTDDGSADPETVRAAYDDPEVRYAVLERAANGADLAVRRDGRVVEVAVLTPIEDPGGGTDPPLVAVDATVESGTLTLEHFAGDRLPLDRVTVQGAGDPISVGEGDLAPGESVAVDVPDADRYVLVYAFPNDETSTILVET